MPQERHSSSLAALVTGGSRGIGRVIAMQLAQRGLRIALHYRNNRDAADAALAHLPGNGHSIFDADLADPDATAQLWQRVVQQFGGVDVLINNAGIYIMNAPLDTDYESWRSVWQRTVGANLLAPATQHPLGRVNRTDEVAAAAVYCALDAPPAMTGGVIDVNGASYLRT